jgi:ubiquinol-cytochrome c reductase iron-sulfur subunit
VHRLADRDERPPAAPSVRSRPLFGISMVATVIFLVAYFAIDQDTYGFIPVIGQANLSNVVLGVTSRPEPAVHRTRRGPLGQDADA